ncbi:MAG: HAD family hydrolase [Treponema sp.]|jgi:putative hydrolase of the HAD superfamily|nr:HAD family hydrolase [Treponema sp.]
MESAPEAVAFDLDGTLYPNYRLNIRLVPFALRELPLLVAFGRARDRLRGGEGPDARILPGEDFYAAQARLVAAALKAPDPRRLQDRIERLIYRGWEAHFRRIRLYPHVRETLDRLRRAGLRLALLSDFPPEQKLRNLGLDGIWDLVLCSEAVGALKPAALPFAELVRGLGLPPGRILYVGNSVSYDIRGAKAAGLRAALVSPLRKSLNSAGGADFCFYDYRKLAQYVLG